MKKMYLLLQRTLKNVGLDHHMDIPQRSNALREESRSKDWRHWRLNNCQFILLYSLSFQISAGQGWFVRKPVKANPALNVNRSNNYSYVKMFFNSYSLGSFRLFKVKTERQLTIQTAKAHRKNAKLKSNSREFQVSLILGFEQPGLRVNLVSFKIF